MEIRAINESEKAVFDKLAGHPLQSWAWGEFRRNLGQKVIRLGRFSKDKLVETAQISLHQIPHTPRTIGYCPRGPMPSREMLTAVSGEAKKHRCIFVKFEPNVMVNHHSQSGSSNDHDLRFTISALRNLGLRPGKSLFTRYSFQLDLTRSEDELLAAMKPKTRYNIRLAEKKGVVVEEDNSSEAFEAFQQLTEETTSRQQFFAHNRRYRQLMWESMKSAGIAKLLVARTTDSRILAIWVIFLYNGVGYYPYGASSNQKRDLMASNLLAWQALKTAKAAGCHTFDFWGSLGPQPDTTDPWYGFHRFKEGYGGELAEFAGTWDLVINPTLYAGFTAVNALRWWWLKRKP